MIQDIYPHQLKNEYHPEKKAHPDSPIFVFEGADVLIKNDEQLAIPRRGERFSGRCGGNLPLPGG